MTRTQIATVVLVMAGTFMIILNQTLLSPVLPVLMADFGVDASTVQWLTSGYALVMAVVIPLSPYLLGRFGSRRLFLASLLFFIAGSVVAALAPAFPVILAGRVLQAIAAGIDMPMAFTIVLLEFPRDRRGSAMGIVMLVVGFAPAIGPTLSGILVDTVGWRALFVLVSVLMLVVAALSLKWLASRDDFEATTFDPASVALSTVGLVALLYGLSSVTKEAMALPSAALIAVGAALLVLFVARQLRLKVPLLRIDVLKVGRYRASVVAIMADSSVTTGMSVLLPLFIQNLLGYSAFVTGLVMLPGALVGALVGLLAGRLFDRRGIRVCAVPGVLCMAAALVGMSLLFEQGVALAVVGLLYGIMFVGLQLLNTTVGTWGLNALDNRVIQHAQATSNTLNQVAASLLTAIVISVTALGPALAGPGANAAAGLEMGYHLGFCTVLAVVAVNVAVVLLFVRDRQPKQADKAVRLVGEYAEGDQPPSGEEVAVAQVMNREPFSIGAEASLRELASLLVRERTGGVAVVDGAGVVVGFVSDGDIMKHLSAADSGLLDATLTLYRFSDPETFASRVGDLMGMRVAGIMTREVVAVEESLSVEQACGILSGRRLRKVPVVDGEGHLVGSLSRSDIVRLTLTDMMARTDGAPAAEAAGAR